MLSDEFCKPLLQQLSRELQTPGLAHTDTSMNFPPGESSIWKEWGLRDLVPTRWSDSVILGPSCHDRGGPAPLCQGLPCQSGSGLVWASLKAKAPSRIWEPLPKEADYRPVRGAARRDSLVSSVDKPHNHVSQDRRLGLQFHHPGWPLWGALLRRHPE